MLSELLLIGRKLAALLNRPQSSRKAGFPVGHPHPGRAPTVGCIDCFCLLYGRIRGFRIATVERRARGSKLIHVIAAI